MPIAYQGGLQNFKESSFISSVVDCVIGPQVSVTAKSGLAAMFEHLNFVQKLVIAVVVAFGDLFFLLCIHGLFLGLGLLLLNYFFRYSLDLRIGVFLLHAVVLENPESLFLIRISEFLTFNFLHHCELFVVHKRLFLIAKVVRKAETL